MKKRLLSLILAVIMIAGMLPVNAFARDADAVVWAGAMNYNGANNQVTSIALPDQMAYTAEKWAYGLNTNIASYNAYYAGQPVIVGDYLYAAGGGKLHKVNVNTGAGEIISESAGSTSGSYYDYMVYADGMLIIAMQKKIEAFDLNGKSLGYAEGDYNYYHPVQYHDGHIICNGFIYKLTKTDDSVTFTQVGTSAIDGARFNWNNGVFANGRFYTVGVKKVYAVDYKTGDIKDSFEFDSDRTASNRSVQGGVSYDSETGRLYWGTYSYNNDIHSIKINADGSIDKESYISADAGQKTVCTPVIAGGRVYLAGQGGKISVHNKTDLTQIYVADVGGGRIQSNPIVSTADDTVKVYVQSYDAHLYVMTDNGENGTVEKLAETKNYSGVPFPNAYEQIAIDNNGNIYCYNESGYLFCFTETECEVPAVTIDLSTEHVKIAKDSAAQALTVAASVTDGGTLSYQWQRSADKSAWSNIEGASEASYAPSTEAESTTYYRCIITNTKDGKTASTMSSAAHILVKVLSNDTTLNVMVNGSNTITSGTPTQAVKGGDGILYVENRSAKVTNIWVGTVDEGTVESFRILQGVPAEKAEPKLTTVASNIYNDIAYLGRYYYNGYSFPTVAKAVVVAEDGVTKNTQYIVIESGAKGQYTISADGFTSESGLFADNKITFTQAGQTVQLNIKQTETLGSGNKRSVWTWTTSDNTVALVDENGVVTSVGGGTATITASCGLMSASCTVTSDAEAHKIHTYGEDGKCTACGTAAPTPVAAHFTLVGADGNFVTSKDGTTEICKVSLTVEDKDFDGALTLNDAFIDLHETHSADGTADFATEESTWGPYITKLWGLDATVGVGYYHNNTSAMGLTEELKRNDVITAYFYRDITDWSDLYTYIEGQTTVGAKFENEYTVNGVASGNTVTPEGALVKVLDSEGKEITSMQTTVGADGKVTLVFENAGNYTIEVSGTADYIGSAWDSSTNGYVDKEFKDVPVIPSRIAVEVKPYAEKTVYVTLSLSDGEFAKGKNGDEIYRLPVTATDDPNAPDGQVSLLETVKALHEQQHTDGASAFAGSSTWIQKLWGNTSQNFGYYVNNSYMDGGGTNAGNGFTFEDKLMGTVMQDGYSANLFIYQDGYWSDKYTYFALVSDSAVAGNAKSFEIKGNSWGRDVIPADAAVTVKDNDGKVIENLSTTVGADGTFTITFPKAGTYTVDVRTNGTNYVTPARLTVHVRPAASNPDTTAENVYIRVYDPQGETYKEETSYKYEEGMTAYSLLVKTGLEVKGSTDHQWGGVYVEKINGFGEFDGGATSGWMYKVNGEFPDMSASLYVLFPGDYVEWVYTRDLGGDVGNEYAGGTTSENAVGITEKLIEAIGDVSLESKEAIGEARTAYDNLSAAQKKLVENYDILLAAESTYAKLLKVRSLPFTDIDGHWAIDAIAYVYEKGLMSGTSDTTFKPDTPLSRGMLATVLYRLEGSPKVTAENPFADVKAGEWYTDAVIWAYEKGIVQGFDGNFMPNDHITREQFALMLMNYAEFKGIDTSEKADLSGFADADEISLWALDAMKWANKTGLITGRDTGIAPLASANRGETATILMRYIENIDK